MKNVVAYLRISTTKGERSGLGIEAQRQYIDTAAKSNGWNVVAAFIETVSGTIAPADRPECAKALAACKEHDADFVVAKLDRVGRDVEHIAGLMKRVDVKVATMPNADNFALHLFAALAEQEREFIAQRTKDALAALNRRAQCGDAESVAKVERRTQALEKGRGVATGGEGAATKAAVAKASAFNSTIKPHLESCLYNKLTTLQAVADCLNSKGVGTSRGSEWTPTAVRRLMLALGLSFDKAA
ncbi:recombinase family protein [Pseudomonas sp.]|uniref:recombinase family protein n=1 Tax=Pseudomonas sp. TaxID=306 RepID=UPI0028A71AAD|nr:recombinase family protein [Pseudomonas sp.]